MDSNPATPTRIGPFTCGNAGGWPFVVGPGGRKPHLPHRLRVATTGPLPRRGIGGAPLLDTAHEGPTARGVEGEPRGCEVGRRIARGEVAEVDHGPQGPVRDHHVRRMEIPVQPHGVPGPSRHRHQALPQPQRAAVSGDVEPAPAPTDDGVPRGQRPASVRIRGSLRVSCGLAVEPRDDASRPWERRGRQSEPDGSWNRDRQTRGEDDSHRCSPRARRAPDGATRSAHDPRGADADDGVVPAVIDNPECVSSQVRV